MSLIVEDGTGVSGADSYITLEYAASYHSALGNAAWAAATSEQQEVALRRAAQYLDFNYYWRGVKTAQTNAREWPRYDCLDKDGYAIASNVIPTEIKNAQAELGLRALAGDLLADVSGGSSVIREKVDAIEVEYEKGQSRQSAYTIVERLLRGLIRGGGGSRVIEMVLG